MEAVRYYKLKNKEVTFAVQGVFSGTVVICVCLQLSYFYFSNVFLTELIVVNPK